VLGDDHHNTLISANNLAQVLTQLGEHEQARELLEDALTRRRRFFGDDHPGTRTTARNLAISLGALGRSAEADRLHRQFPPKPET
jgi:hypothetical protein